MEFLQKKRENMSNIVVEKDRFMHHVGIEMQVVSKEYTKVKMDLKTEHLNGNGFAHGGVIFTLADIAFGAAANEGLEDGFVVTMNSHIDYLRPGAISPLYAEAKLIRAGRNIMNYEINVLDANGQILAKCLTTGFKTPAKK